MSKETDGKFFREAWITGVKKHFPGTPKPGYIAPWAEISSWEQESASAVYEQVQQFVRVTDGKTMRLSREQKGVLSVSAGLDRSSNISLIPNPLTWLIGRNCPHGSRKQTPISLSQ